MNMFVKSIYVMVYMMGINALTMYSAYQLYTGGFDVGWAGVLLASFPGAAFFDYVTMTKSMARTTANMPLITATTLTGVVVVIASSINHTGNHPGNHSGQSLLQLALGIAGFTGWLLYNYWYSRYGERDASMLKVGNKLPEFSLQDLRGDTVSSSQFQGKPTLFLFYRGNWCPLCMAQIKEIAHEYQSLQRRGAQIVLVSPQPHKHTQKLAEKHDVPFIYMIDKDNRAAGKLKILSPNGLPAGMQAMGYDSDTVMPTVVITDSEGKILFADLTDNYRVRPEPITFTRVLDAYLSRRASVNSALAESADS